MKLDLRRVLSARDHREVALVHLREHLTVLSCNNAEVGVLLAEAFGNARTLNNAHQLDRALMDVQVSVAHAREALRPLLITRSA